MIGKMNVKNGLFILLVKALRASQVKQMQFSTTGALTVLLNL
jgi:hypothetical protein